MPIIALVTTTRPFGDIRLLSLGRGSIFGDVASRNGERHPSLSLEDDDGGVGGKMNVP